MAPTLASTSPLLDKLPAELRNIVYALVLHSDAPIKIESQSIKTHTALLRTCTQIRSEASQMFYKCNDFHIDLALGGNNSTMKWLTAIGKDVAATLGGLRVKYDVSAVYEDLRRAVREDELAGPPSDESGSLMFDAAARGEMLAKQVLDTGVDLQLLEVLYLADEDLSPWGDHMPLHGLIHTVHMGFEQGIWDRELELLCN